MPKRTDIKSILLIGSGPIVIGQACEFDYSGTQAMKVLKSEGFRVILVNSNPATIMTDPEFADQTYIEPITAEVVERILEKERPDAVLPTMGGQTALNVTLELADRGILERYGCKLIGASVEAICTAEDRELFRKAMDEIGLESANSAIVHNLEEGRKAAAEIGYPLILRPSRTLGGAGGAVVESEKELDRKIRLALSVSPNSEVLVEQSLIGWKEIELEVMRDLKDNVVIVCGIENIDPMGVHTGDSITVAPILTLTDKEYQALRDAAIRVIRRIGVDTGGSNVQFAINPENGKIIIIEMNPRVSRSSALASKATGFPIAKIAALLAVGYTLDEIQNDITRETPACFEPSIDYVVTKIPRFNFEKFPLAEQVLGTQMKSVGEVMAIGRTFAESFQKALCSLELDRPGFGPLKGMEECGTAELLESSAVPGPERIWFVAAALRAGTPVDELYKKTGIDPWFLEQFQQLMKQETVIQSGDVEKVSPEEMLQWKQNGFSDERISELSGIEKKQIRAIRKKLEITPAYRSVDTCAAEFVAHTPYLYSSYDGITGKPQGNRKKIVILGSGPNRIGQGIEFDYCCVHAVLGLKEDGYETIMVNCNPETVSTDYDISDRLYFEPLTLEHVLEILDREQPDGVIVQFGGQTPLKLASDLHAAGVPILGTSVESIDAAEDREQFTRLVKKLKLAQPEFATVTSLQEAVQAANAIGYPLMTRPSFVLGGRAMRVVYSEQELRTYIEESVDVSNQRPVLLDRFLENAIEVDVDAVSDGSEVLIAGVMEHIERAGIHSGDSSCCIPPPTLSGEVIGELKRQARVLAKELQVCGLMNIQFAVRQDGSVYILEVNPRASRTVPFVSKATGTPWAKVAARVMAGKTLKELEISEPETLPLTAVKACVFPFSRFPGVDTLLGPEMKSTGEVMGIDGDFSGAFARAQVAAGNNLPEKGVVCLSVRDKDKPGLLKVAKRFCDCGFRIIATSGTATFLQKEGVDVQVVNKVREGSPHIVDLLGEGKVDIVINTPEGSGPVMDSTSIRLVSHELRIPTFTTIAAAEAVVGAIEKMQKTDSFQVKSLQEYHR